MARGAQKHWSRWDSLRLALMSDDAVKRRWPGDRSRRRRALGNPLVWTVGFALLALAVLAFLRYGRLALDVFIAAVCLLWLVITVTVPTLNRSRIRKLVELRRERLRVVRGLERVAAEELLEDAANSVARRRLGAQARIEADLGRFRGLLTVAKFNPIAWRLCSIAWMLFLMRGMGMKRVYPWLEEASLGGAAVLMAIVYFVTRADRQLLRIAGPKSLCPDCGYPLADVVPKFADAGRSLGPERCTECGGPWPLIPPDGLGPKTTTRPELRQVAGLRSEAATQLPVDGSSSPQGRSPPAT